MAQPHQDQLVENDEDRVAAAKAFFAEIFSGEATRMLAGARLLFPGLTAVEFKRAMEEWDTENPQERFH